MTTAVLSLSPENLTAPSPEHCDHDSVTRRVIQLTNRCRPTSEALEKTPLRFSLVELRNRRIHIG